MNSQMQVQASPYWLIIKGSTQRGGIDLEVLSTNLRSGKSLLVFTSLESAERFRVGLSTANLEEDAQSEWRVQGVGAGELISLLSGSAFSAGACAGVERVVLDPSPELMHPRIQDEFSEATGEGPGESRRCFIERLMGRGRTWFESKEPRESV